MNRQPDRNRLRALDGVEPPEQWDDIVLRSETDLARLHVPPARPSHRLLVAAVLIVLGGLAGVLALSTATGGGGEPEVVAADGGNTSPFPAGGGDAPGSDATTPDGLPVPTTAPNGPDGGGNGPGSGGSSGSGSQSGGSSGSGNNANPRSTTTTTTAPSDQTTTTAATPSTSTSSTTTIAGSPTTTVTPPTQVDAGDEVPPDPPPPSVWGKRWQVRVMAQGGVKVPFNTDQLMSLDARTEGRLILEVCNRTVGTASIDKDRLVVVLGRKASRTCGVPLDAHEAFLATFFDNDPTFAFDGNRLVFTVGTRRVELTPY